MSPAVPSLPLAPADAEARGEAAVPVVDPGHTVTPTSTATGGRIEQPSTSTTAATPAEVATSPVDEATAAQQIQQLFNALAAVFTEIPAEVGTAAEPDRLQRLAAEVAAGTRNVADIQNDLLQFVANQRGSDINTVAQELVAGLFNQAGLPIATGTETEEQRLARIASEMLTGAEGTNLDPGRTFADILTALQPFTEEGQLPTEIPPAQPPTPGQPITDQPVAVDDSTIPAGATLLIVTGDNPGDLAEYFLQYEWNGVTFNFSIGSPSEFNDLFPSGSAAFPTTNTISRRDFVDSGQFAFTVGTIDEILGSEESLAVTLQRQFDLLGLESLPEWILNSPEAMTIMVQASNEGWSPGRTANALADTQAFAERFPGFDAIARATGSNDILFNIGQYLTEETGIRQALLNFRGEATDVSNEFIGQLIGTGWIASEVSELLDAERLLNTTDALDNLNELLAFQGLDALDPTEFLDIATGNPTVLSQDIFEAINDALRQTALETQGLDISTELAEFLGQGTSLSVADQGTFSQAARAAALNVASNINELDLGLFGLTREDIIAATFNDATLSGKPASEIENLLGKLARNRTAAARGFESQQAFLNAKGRLILPGIGGG